MIAALWLLNPIKNILVLIMFGSIGFSEILIIVLIISILFGAKRIPEIAKGIGKGIRDFKKEIKSIEEITK